MIGAASHAVLSANTSGVLRHGQLKRALLSAGNYSGHTAKYCRRPFASGDYKSFRDRRREALPAQSNSNSWGGVVVSALTVVGGAASAVIMANADGW